MAAAAAVVVGRDLYKRPGAYFYFYFYYYYYYHYYYCYYYQKQFCPDCYDCSHCGRKGRFTPTTGCLLKSLEF